ncbi:MAG: hypothetical protein SGJ07_08135 [Rhodospirillaceae bacterium]|nr:hypothetical protein [Rhodospirillaceae bacterium]
MIDENPANMPINMSARRIRINAAAMQLVADLDGRYVELHVITNTGQTVAITCGNDSIFAIQRHIEQMAEECPEIASWAAQESTDAR